MMNVAPLTRLIVRVVDLSATFVFAAEGALTGAFVGLDVMGMFVLAFLTGLGGGILRDLLLDERPAAITDWHYSIVVMSAVGASWLLIPIPWISSAPLVVTLDAVGLSLAAVAGTEKALTHRVHPVVSILLGALSGVGGGLLGDVMINQVPRVLRTDIYASAALLGSALVVLGRSAKLDPRLVAVVGGTACFALRLLAHNYGWSLPIAAAYR